MSHRWDFLNALLNRVREEDTSLWELPDSDDKCLITDLLSFYDSSFKLRSSNLCVVVCKSLFTSALMMEIQL